MVRSYVEKVLDALLIVLILAYVDGLHLSMTSSVIMSNSILLMVVTIDCMRSLIK